MFDSLTRFFIHFSLQKITCPRLTYLKTLTLTPKILKWLEHGEFESGHQMNLMDLITSCVFFETSLVFPWGSMFFIFGQKSLRDFAACFFRLERSFSGGNVWKHRVVAGC